MALGLKHFSGLAKRPWWSGKPAGQEAAPAVVKYPPVAAGIPALPVAEILSPHGETLAKIRHLVEREADWGRWYRPLIERYASFVHLLPASEYHHHRGAGGLLAHGLEVGLYTLQQAREMLYGMHLEPKVRREARPRWQYGCFLAGLCHDVGKPVALLRATLVPEGGLLVDWDEQVWQPYAEDLLAWCRRHGSERYWVSFRPRQARDHEKTALLIWDRVVTEGDRRVLSEYDGELLPVVLAALQGGAEENDLAKAVRQADRRSVQEDLGKSHQAQDVGPGVGLPVLRIYSDAMLRLLRDGAWRVNEPGGRLWYVESGLYMVWPEGGRDLGALLDRDEAYRGVPRNPQTMAEILLEWRYIEATPGGSPYWWVSVEGVTVEKPLLALQVREPRGLLEVLPPPWPGAASPYETGQEPGEGSGQAAEEKSEPGETEASRFGRDGESCQGRGEESIGEVQPPDGIGETVEPAAEVGATDNQEDRGPVLPRLRRWLSGGRAAAADMLRHVCRLVLVANLPLVGSLLGWTEEGDMTLEERELVLAEMAALEAAIENGTASEADKERLEQILLDLLQIAVYMRARRGRYGAAEGAGCADGAEGAEASEMLSDLVWMVGYRNGRG